MSFAMFWQILWPLILGFTISGIIQAVVSKRQMVELMGNDSPKTLATASGLGAASSSCSYAAVAIARSAFTKGASGAGRVVIRIAELNSGLGASLSLDFCFAARRDLREAFRPLKRNSRAEASRTMEPAGS